MDSKLELSNLSTDQRPLAKASAVTVQEVSDDVPIPATKASSKYYNYVDRWWLWESSAWLISFAALVGMIGLLGAVHNHEIPQWGIRRKFHGTDYSISISINAVLSLSATTMKTALIIPVAASLSQLKWNWFMRENKLLDYQKFEAASRGPFGALILIWTLRGRRLACLGAFIIIAALSLDFAFQQLVSYPVRPSETTQRAQMPVSTYYDKALLPTVGGQIVSDNVMSPEQSMLGDIYTGTYNYNGSFLTTPSCETGNCTWPELYHSLGVCGQCADVSADLQQTCGNYEGSMSVQTDDPTLTYANTTLPYCTYSLPNGLSVSSQSTSFDDYGNYTFMNVSSSLVNVSAFGNIGNTISVLSILRPQWIPRLLNGTETSDPSAAYQAYGWIISVSATQCSLYFCVKQFNGTVSQGKFTETVVSTIQNKTASSIYAIDQSNQFDFNSLNFTINVQSGGHSSSYNISGDAYFGLTQPFYDWWDGIATGNIFAMTPNSNTKGYSSYIIQLLDGLDTTGIHKTVHNLADSITNNIRTSSNEYALGNTILYTPIVVVVWRWLVLPATLLFLALVFLLSTIVLSSKDDAKLWKGNGLMSFYHPLSSEGRRQLLAVQGPRQMEEVAENLRVRWTQTEKGWRLVPGASERGAV